MDKEKIISVPTVKGIGSSFKELGIGALGGLALVFAYQMFGSLAFLIAPLLVGSMMKNETGRVIVVISGIALGASLLGGLGDSTGTSNTSGQVTV